MLGLLTRAPRPALCPGLLTVECLEDRYSPSTLTMDVTYLPNQQVTLSGDLSAPPGQASYQTIIISGAAQGTASTDINGHFVVTLQATQLGAVTAQTADGQSNVAQVTLTSGQACINSFVATSLGNCYWDISGQVVGDSSQFTGVTIQFGGLLAGQSMNINPDGTFDLVVYAPDPSDVVTATAVNWWGDMSSDAAVTIYGQMNPMGGGGGGLT